jgi:head-tail adaptor
MRDTISILRPGEIVMPVAGVTEGDLAVFYGPVRASILPLKGGDQVQAARATRIATFDIQIRWSTLASQIQNGDVLRNERTSELLKVTWAVDFDGRRQWMRIQAETGASVG